MKDEDKKEIERISKEFAEPFYTLTMGINASGFIIVDPLSAYLNACGYKNTLHELPANGKHPQILVMTFEDGTQFIPAGADLHNIHKDATNWIWI